MAGRCAVDAGGATGDDNPPIVPQHPRTAASQGVSFLKLLTHLRAGRFARAPRPDLILLDLTLPKKDGRDFLAEIKSDEDLRTIPVVVLTSSTDEEDVAQTQVLEVESYMTKPVDIEKFLKLIRDLARYWRADMILPT